MLAQHVTAGSLRAQLKGNDRRQGRSSKPKPFDPWLICEHPEIAALVSRAEEDGERDAERSRIRKRRDKDREAYHLLARTLVANAAYALALGLEPPTVGISLATAKCKRSRYDGHEAPRPIDTVLSTVEPRFVTITRSRR